ncbi:MAG: shikimate kinase [Bacteroidia bacterium]|jgi:shikimate kinase
MNSPLFICGMPGSGKSTLGKKIAAKLGGTFIDLDNLIEQHTGIHPAAWLTQHGETAFRTVETETLQNLELKPLTIISCGGGTPCFNDNLHWMLQKGKVVYLDVPIGMLVHRLQQANASERPLLKGALTFEGITSIYQNRKEWYDCIPLAFRPHEEKLEDLLLRLEF